MKMKFLASLALAGALGAALPGCVGTPDGHSKAGVPFTKDTITSRYEKPAAQLASAARVVLNRNGKLSLDNSINNTFQARVDQRDVWVKVTDLDGKVTEVVVQARGRATGDVDLAAEISKQIGMELMAQR
ncbi:MAG TPA: hypothetical protein VHB20_13460 [Verrucomicrobiae bacterium]|jgi:hypothetical protein|nr:hypothetical protein [Verrucomicrobiae bacterium]